MSETAAAATRKIAGAGTGTRSVSDVESAATAKPAVTTRMMVPKSVISVMATDADQTSRHSDQDATRLRRRMRRSGLSVAADVLSVGFTNTNAHPKGARRGLST